MPDLGGVWAISTNTFTPQFPIQPLSPSIAVFAWTRVASLGQGVGLRGCDSTLIFLFYPPGPLKLQHLVPIPRWTTLVWRQPWSHGKRFPRVLEMDLSIITRYFTKLKVEKNSVSVHTAKLNKLNPPSARSPRWWEYRHRGGFPLWPARLPKSQLLCTSLEIGWKAPSRELKRCKGILRRTGRSSCDLSCSVTEWMGPLGLFQPFSE